MVEINNKIKQKISLSIRINLTFRNAHDTFLFFVFFCMQFHRIKRRVFYPKFPPTLKVCSQTTNQLPLSSFIHLVIWFSHYLPIKFLVINGVFSFLLFFFNLLNQIFVSNFYFFFHQILVGCLVFIFIF